MNKYVQFLLLGAGAMVLASNALAHAKPVSYKGEAIESCSRCMMPANYFYVAGSLGVSHLYDNKARGSADSVDENGPGWDATLGYQINRYFGGELGYTQYYNSRETFGRTVVAKTTHFATHLNATGRYPIYEKFDAVGKLGLAYAYAQKVFEATGAAGSSGSVSPYVGLGVAYHLTQQVNLTGQWAWVRGNSYTGSNTLYSIGLEFAIV